MKFTEEQMTFLAEFEDRMTTAVRSQWCRGLQSYQYEQIYALWREVSGTNIERNPNCASCVLTLLTDVGRAYFAQKEAAERVQVKQAKATAKRSVKINGNK